MTFFFTMIPIYWSDLDVPSRRQAEHLLEHGQYGRDMLSPGHYTAGQPCSISALLLSGCDHSDFGRCLDRRLGDAGLSDVFLAFPGLVFALAVAGTLGGGLQTQ